MATKLYTSSVVAPYTPATIRGAWDQTTGAITKALLLDKVESLVPSLVFVGDRITRNDTTETSTTNNWDMLNYRGVSPPLDSNQTITGTVDVITAIMESAGSANMVYHVHIYVTQGDSDTPRGTLLTDFVDSSELGSFGAGGKAFTSAQSLSSVSAQTGDRIVVEIGVQAQNTVSTSHTNYFQYGTTTQNAQVGDMTVGGSQTGLAGYVTFSQDITFATTPNIRTSLAGLEIAIAETPANIRVSQVLAEVLYIEAPGTVEKVDCWID